MVEGTRVGVEKIRNELLRFLLYTFNPIMTVHVESPISEKAFLEDVTL